MTTEFTNHLSFTGERFLPEIKGDIELEHLHRYFFASQAVCGKIVLDIASGEGYGSKILAKHAEKVIGIDISIETVNFARNKYKNKNIEFAVGSCSAIPIKDNSVDIVVSFETIEHHSDHEIMMHEVKRILKPNGILIISSPDKYEYSEKPKYKNEFHVKELYRDQFKLLIETHFKNFFMYGQRVTYGSTILIEDEESPVTSYDMADEQQLKFTGVPNALYLIAVASDRFLPKIGSGILKQGIENSPLVQSLISLVSERETQITKLNQKLYEQNVRFEGLNRALSERDAQITSIEQRLSEREIHIDGLNQLLTERNGLIEMFQLNLKRIEAELNQLVNSKSWIITKPLRSFRRKFFTRPYLFFRKLVSDYSHWCWFHLPVSMQVKQKIKETFFKRLPFMFSWTTTYLNWKKINAPIVLAPIDTMHNDLFSLNKNELFESQKNQFVPLLESGPPEIKKVKIVCFYLPQFHRIPENDAWWGEGFTEWTNVISAVPQFVGHYQPHVPGELGYYDLLDPEIQRRQVELAELYGIEGFCFYFYWFGGKRLLETPIINYLNNKDLKLSFCLCWANENWSRRWDGLDNDVLIAQDYSPEDDLAFIEYVAHYMRDPRYIRINGKPLLLVYRPGLLPSAKATVQRWRHWCSTTDIGEIFLSYTQSFESVDPKKYGFDATIEFPPNRSNPPNITNRVSPIVKNFASTVYNWQIFLERSNNYKQTGYKLFRSVCPNWDNTARRKNNGTVFLNNTPELYQRWLENATADVLKHTSNPDERLIFVNAWNEWAEGAHLEPDIRYGYAWLQATRNAVSGKTSSSKNKKKIVLVAHDAHPHGAQMLVLNLAKTLNQNFFFQIDLVCLGEGPLKVEYSKWATVHDLSKSDPLGADAIKLAKELYRKGHRRSLVNTTVSGLFLQTLSVCGFTCVALVHELKGVIESFGLNKQAIAIAKYANKIVFAAPEVASSFCQIVDVDNSKVVIRPQGLYKRTAVSKNRFKCRSRLRQLLQIPNNTQIVLGVGYADHRKGIDLFVKAGIATSKKNPNVRWVWIGHWEPLMKTKVEAELRKNKELKDVFIFPGLQNETELFYAGADLLALTSREDPFPSVVLEALDFKLPVIGFDGAGGFNSLLREGCGKIVQKEDYLALADAVLNLLNNPNEIDILGKRGKEIINDRFSFRHYIFDLLELLNDRIERISVVLPNYNYKKYLSDRLLSILNQSYPIFEIIFLDDSSVDNSVKVAKEILENDDIDYKIIVSKVNSGSVFKQWKKGVNLAKGDKIWIAEADDFADENFLETLLKAFENKDVVIAYTQSKQVDKFGKILCSSYLEYVNDVSDSKWKQSYYNNGLDEIINGFSVKNTIPNVSAVLFKRDAIKDVLNTFIKEILFYRVAGDWFVYVNVLKNGSIYYHHKPLNNHRRHLDSVTIKQFGLEELKEIATMQNYVANQFTLPGEMKTISKAYLKELIDHFSLKNRYSEKEIESAISYKQT